MENKVSEEEKHCCIYEENKELNTFWRKVQREQLGISANVYLTFTTAVLGFMVNFLSQHLEIIKSGLFMFSSITGNIFLIISITFYSLFTHNRLKDFRETARLYKNNKTTSEVASLTHQLGQTTWYYYQLQTVFLILGVLFSIVALSDFFIYSL